MSIGVGSPPANGLALGLLRGGGRPAARRADLWHLLALNPGCFGPAAEALRPAERRFAEPQIGSLYEFAPDLHVEESVIRFYGFRLQTRMAVILLPGGRLLLYSPVWLTPELRSALEQLGEVAYILAPNKIHNQTLRAYAHAYPAAEIHAPPGLVERCPELPITGTLCDEAPPAWRDQIDQGLTSGNVFFSEVVLLHRPSRTLLVADLVENFDASTASLLARAGARLFGVGRQPIGSPEFRLYTHEAQPAAQAFARILRWDFDRIFLCHGRLITEQARQVLQRVTDGIVRSAERRGRASRWLLRGLARVQ